MKTGGDSPSIAKSGGTDLKRRTLLQGMIAGAAAVLQAGMPSAVRALEAGVPLDKYFEPAFADTAKRMMAFVERIRSSAMQQILGEPTRRGEAFSHALYMQPRLTYEMLRPEVRERLEARSAMHSFVLTRAGNRFRIVAGTRLRAAGNEQLIREIGATTRGQATLVRVQGKIFLLTNAHVIAMVDPDPRVRKRAQDGSRVADVAFYGPISAEELATMGATPAAALDMIANGSDITGELLTMIGVSAAKKEMVVSPILLRNGLRSAFDYDVADKPGDYLVRLPAGMATQIEPGRPRHIDGFSGLAAYSLDGSFRGILQSACYIRDGVQPDKREPYTADEISGAFLDHFAHSAERRAVSGAGEDKQVMFGNDVGFFIDSAAIMRAAEDPERRFPLPKMLA